MLSQRRGCLDVLTAMFLLLGLMTCANALLHSSRPVAARTGSGLAARRRPCCCCMASSCCAWGELADVPDERIGSGVETCWRRLCVWTEVGLGVSSAENRSWP